MMKRPPILIIINLFLLTSGYFYLVYLSNAKMTGVIEILEAFLFLTLGITGIYIVVLRRHAISILLLGAILSLYIISLLPGIIFIIWGMLILSGSRNPAENTSIANRTKCRHWLYSAIIFLVASMLLGILISSLENTFNTYEHLQKRIYIILVCILIAGIVQLVIYFSMCRRRELIEKKTNCPESGGSMVE